LDAGHTGFRLGFNGPVPDPRSTVILAANAAPADVLFNGAGHPCLRPRLLAREITGIR
jgi:hypothetical protein